MPSWLTPRVQNWRSPISKLSTRQFAPIDRNTACNIFSAIIANLVSGSVLIYTRAFRVSDQIKIGEISGKVLETTLLVTRILTPTNVIISIPNAQISTSAIETPAPFVLQGELNQVYVTYRLNAYVDVVYFQDKTLKEIEQVRSQLHENIRDCCTEAGIRLFAPNYEADPPNYGPAANSAPSPFLRRDLIGLGQGRVDLNDLSQRIEKH